MREYNNNKKKKEKRTTTVTATTWSCGEVLGICIVLLSRSYINMVYLKSDPG
jgi:hypothetical protein